MLPRTLRSRLQSLAGPFPVVFLTGPRQSGKTTLARTSFPDFQYLSLEDLQVRDEALHDPRGFLEQLRDAEGVILDEVQRAPDLFSYLQGAVDDGPERVFILTGSQHFLLSERINQSLAGRAAILELMPFSLAELVERPPRTPDTLFEPPARRSREKGIDLDDMLFGGLFPPIHDRQLEPQVWLNGYLQTYVERDVRSLAGVGDLDAFSRFLGLCAGRVGQLVNTSSLGADAGISHVTAKRWLSILRASYVINLLRPHFVNFSKRLIKTPKLYFNDTGLVCYLLGIRKQEDLRLHPLRGAIFENFVVNEISKVYSHHGERPPLYFWRTQKGQEVDLVIDHGTSCTPLEVKAGKTFARDFCKGLDLYTGLSGNEGGVVVYGGDESYRRGKHQIRSWYECS